MNKGYLSWLEEHGVIKIFEDSSFENIHEACNSYDFATPNGAKQFCEKFGLPDKLINYRTVSIYPKEQQFLKNKYLEENNDISLEDCDKQLSLINDAIKKIKEFNKVEIDSTKQIKRDLGFLNPVVEDRIGNVAELLTNNKNSWTPYSSVSAIDVMISIYHATNYHFLSEEERQYLKRTKTQILQTNQAGRFIAGLKADTNFKEYISEQLLISKARENIVELIREDVDLLLNGGKRLIIDKDTPGGLTTIKANNALESDTYYQKRFFPDKNGKSETDIIILQAGGMEGHSSMRILRKEKDSSTPGGYKYFYTKVDGGAGAENSDLLLGKADGIYTTEIKPYFKLTKLVNGASVLDTDDNGKPIPLTVKEIKDFNNRAYWREDRV